MIEVTKWHDGKRFTVSKKKYIDRNGIYGVWLYHDPHGDMKGGAYEGYSNDFAGHTNRTHEEVFKRYPKIHARYLKELIKSI